MNICKQCGVELEQTMKACPLCDRLVSNTDSVESEVSRSPDSNNPRRRQVMQRVLWQITAVLLFSGIIATLVINLAIKGEITWSIYPISICLMILAYASLMALWQTRFIFHLIGGWLISALLLIVVHVAFSTEWPLAIALPILSVINTLAVLFHFALKKLRTIGLNVIALILVLAAVLSLAIETILSLYSHDTIQLSWSVIVAACMLPVTAAILFMYFRTRNNPELKKVFHT